MKNELKISFQITFLVFLSLLGSLLILLFFYSDSTSIRDFI